MYSFNKFFKQFSIIFSAISLAIPFKDFFVNIQGNFSMILFGKWFFREFRANQQLENLLWILFFGILDANFHKPEVATNIRSLFQPAWKDVAPLLYR